MNCLRRHMCWQSKRFYWERVPGWRAVGSGNPGEQLSLVARSLGFFGDGISFWVVFSSHSDSESFMVVPTLFSHDGYHWGFWEMVGHVVSPFDLSPTLAGGGGLLVQCSLPGPPVLNNSCKCLLWCLARVGGFSQRASPNGSAHCTTGQWIRETRCWGKEETLIGELRTKKIAG